MAFIQPSRDPSLCPDSALEDLYQEACRKIGLALSFGATPWNADDLLRDSFLRAVQRWDRKRPFWHLFNKILRCLCVNERRKEARDSKHRFNLTDRCYGTSVESPENLMIQQELRGLLKKAMGNLPSKQRNLLYMKFVDEEISVPQMM